MTHQCALFTTKKPDATSYALGSEEEDGGQDGDGGGLGGGVGGRGWKVLKPADKIASTDVLHKGQIAFFFSQTSRHAT